MQGKLVSTVVAQELGLGEGLGVRFHAISLMRMLSLRSSCELQIADLNYLAVECSKKGPCLHHLFEEPEA